MTSQITTQRLRLRPWRMDEFQALANMLQDPQTMHHWPKPLEDDEVQFWLQRNVEQIQERGFSRWCCERIEDQAIVGDVGLAATEILGEAVIDLGYIIHVDYWYQGFGFEAAEGVVKWAKQHGHQFGINGASGLIANMANDNKPSASVAEKLGMQLEKTFVNPNNDNKDTYLYRLVW